MCPLSQQKKQETKQDQKRKEKISGPHSVSYHAKTKEDWVSKNEQVTKPNLARQTAENPDWI